MTTYEAKKELISYLSLENSMKELKEWINNKKYNSNKVTATLSTEPKGSPKHQDQMAEKLTYALDTESKINAKIEQLKKKKEIILNKVLNIEIPYQTVLFDIYIAGKTIEETALSIHYSRSQTIRIKDKALEIYAKM